MHGSHVIPRLFFHDDGAHASLNRKRKNRKEIDKYRDMHGSHVPIPMRL